MALKLYFKFEIEKGGGEMKGGGKRGGNRYNASWILDEIYLCKVLIEKQIRDTFHKCNFLIFSLNTRYKIFWYNSIQQFNLYERKWSKGLSLCHKLTFSNPICLQPYIWYFTLWIMLDKVVHVWMSYICTFFVTNI